MKVAGKSSTYGLQALVADVLRTNPRAALTNAQLRALLPQTPGLPPDRTEIARCLSRLVQRGQARPTHRMPAQEGARGGPKMARAYAWTDSLGA